MLKKKVIALGVVAIAASLIAAPSANAGAKLLQRQMSEMNASAKAQKLQVAALTDLISHVPRLQLEPLQGPSLVVPRDEAIWFT